MGDKAFSIGTLESALGAIFNGPEGFRVIEHGDNVYQFFFTNETDTMRVELGSPWLFKNHVLHLRRWNEEMKIEEEDFSNFPIWVQI